MPVATIAHISIHSFLETGTIKSELEELCEYSFSCLQPIGIQAISVHLQSFDSWLLKPLGWNKHKSPNNMLVYLTVKENVQPFWVA